MTIVESVRSLLCLHYPSFEVVVVNDGSTDDTLVRMLEAFSLRPVARQGDTAVSHRRVRGIFAAAAQPKLLLVDKENGGKSDALNAGINLARAPIICSMDADSLLDPDALLRAARAFIDDPHRTVAVGGMIRLANGCRVDGGRVVAVGVPRNPLALLQTVEYLRVFVVARLAWSRLGALTIISGAFGLFSRQAVIDVDGYSHGTVGEDMELVVKLHRHFREKGRPYRITCVPEPVCWTEAPETLTLLGRQRARWHRGTLETFSRHRDMLFNPRYGRVGLLGFGCIFLTDIFGPIVELLGYATIPVFWAAGMLSTPYFLAVLSVSFTFGVAVSVGAVALEETGLRRFPKARDLLLLAGAAVIENFGYRQLNNFWRLAGTWQFLRKTHAWGAMTRRGFHTAQPPGAAATPQLS